MFSGLVRVLRMQYKYADLVVLCKKGLADAQGTNRLLFHTELVRAYQFLGDHKAALTAAEAGVRDADGDNMLLCRRLRADALAHVGESAKALAECQALLKHYNTPGDLREVRGTLSSVYQTLGKPEEAERQLQLILETDPNDATANNDLGYVWADRNKNLEEAERLIRKAIDLDRMQRNAGATTPADPQADNAAYVDSLGWVLFRRGKLDEAAKELERASQMSGGDDDPVVWDHLGDVLHRSKHPLRALNCWRKAVSLFEAGRRRKGDPRHREILEKIELLAPRSTAP